MAASDQLTLAIEMAQRKREVQEISWLALRQKHQNALDLGQQLQDHANQLDQQWLDSASQPVALDLMLNHQQFVSRLLQALGLQNSVIQDFLQQVKFAHQQLLELDTKLKGLQLIQDKKLAAAQKLKSKQEQRSLDEFSARQHRQKITAQRLPEQL